MKPRSYPSVPCFLPPPGAPRPTAIVLFCFRIANGISGFSTSGLFFPLLSEQKTTTQQKPKKSSQNAQENAKKMQRKFEDKSKKIWKQNAGKSKQKSFALGIWLDKIEGTWAKGSEQRQMVVFFRDNVFRPRAIRVWLYPA